MEHNDENKNNGNSLYDKDIRKPYKGMSVDNLPIEQPEGTYRFAQNAIMSSSTGMSISNEGGTDYMTRIDMHDVIIGKTYTVDNQIILFTVGQGFSSIGKIGKNGNYVKLISSEELAFDVNYPIQAIYRLRRGCEHVVYFTDGKNPVRFYNITRPEKHLTNGVFDISKTVLQQRWMVPDIPSMTIVNEGKLRPGSYNFGIQYLDQDLNATQVLYTTNTLNIYHDNYDSSYHNIQGSSMYDVDNRAGKTATTNKAILLRMSNLDQSFAYYKIICIEATGFTGLVTAIYASPPINISKNTFLYTGDVTGFTKLTEQEILSKDPFIETAKNIEQIEGHLILADVKDKEIDWSRFQRSASKIVSSAKTHGFNAFNAVELGNSKSGIPLMGYQSDEVYAFGIVYVFADGYESPAFHIPGRPANYFYDINESKAVQFPNSYETQIILGDKVFVNQARWKSEDTAPELGGNYWGMNYYECNDATYPEIIGCDGESFWGTDYYGQPVSGKIRHHRFPSRSGNEAVFTIDGKQYALIGPALLSEETPAHLAIVFDNIKNVDGEYPHPDVTGHYIVRGTRDEFNRTVIDECFGKSLLQGASTDSGCLNVSGGEVFDYAAFNTFKEIVDADDETITFTRGIYLFNPKHSFIGKPCVGNQGHLKMMGYYEITAFGPHCDGGCFDGKGGWTNETDNCIEVSYVIGSGYTQITSKNLKITKEGVLKAISYDKEIFGMTAYNMSWVTPIQVANIEENDESLLNMGGPMQYVFLYKVQNEVHPYLDSIKYRKVHEYLGTSNRSAEINGGDVYISMFEVQHSSVRNIEAGAFETIFKIGLATILTAGAIAVTVLTAGATAPITIPLVSAISALFLLSITAIGVETYYKFIISGCFNSINKDVEGNGIVPDEDSTCKDTSGPGDRMFYNNEHLYGIMLESEIPCELRQDVTGDCGKVFRSSIDVTTPRMFDFFKEQWLYVPESDEDIKYAPRTIPCPTIYHINRDYMRENLQTIYKSIPYTFDLCSPCISEYKNRILWSLRSFQEESSDAYKIFKANNYTDLEGSHGYITAIMAHGNNLAVFAEECLWIFPQSQQERITGEIVSFVGTGEMFSIPPRKVLDDNMGSAGTSQKWSITKTPHGIVFISDKENCVYLYGDKLTVISDIGMSSFFDENIKMNLESQISNRTPFLNFSNPMNPYGTGFISVYDKSNDRVLFTKRDSSIIADYITLFRDVETDEQGEVIDWEDYTEDQLLYDITTQRFLLTPETNWSGTNYSIITAYNTNVFEDKSWTLSFGFNVKAWISFHSYRPCIYLSNQERFFSYNLLATLTTKRSEIHGHNSKTVFNKYYGLDSSFIVEVVMNSKSFMNTINYDIAIQAIIKSIVENDDLISKIIIFDRALFYNARQCSGMVDILVKNENSEDYLEEQVTETEAVIIADNREGNWYINDIRDYVVNRNIPLFLTTWETLKGTLPIGERDYIDKMVNPDAIDLEKPWFELEFIRDRYMMARFYFDKTDYNIIVQYILNSNIKSLF
jgi:hypothetical protein